MRKRISIVTCVMMFLSVSPLAAQGSREIAGAWERFSLKDTAGLSVQPPAPAAFAIYTDDGFYAQVAIPAGRRKVAKPLNQLTRDELVERFTELAARRGRYTISGNTLTRTDIAHSNPTEEGAKQVQNFRIDGDVLILTTPGTKVEARFRRVKP